MPDDQDRDEGLSHQDLAESRGRPEPTDSTCDIICTVMKFQREVEEIAALMAVIPGRKQKSARRKKAGIIRAT